MTLPSRWLQKLPLALVPKVVDVSGTDTYITFTMSGRWHWCEEMVSTAMDDPIVDMVT